MELLFIVSIISCVIQIVKEKTTPKIPAENWANRELYHQDIMSGVPVEQRLKYAKQGRYKL